jgi:uncharacterized DUF497 family protein
MTGAFEWDDEKYESNLAKHGVDFLRVTAIFDGRVIETIDSRREYGEARVRCLGELNGRIYFVAYTWRGESRRLISARKANAREQRAYYAHHGGGSTPTA